MGKIGTSYCQVQRRGCRTFIGPSVFGNVELESHHLLTERAFLQACHQSSGNTDLLVQPFDLIHPCGLYVVKHYSCHSDSVLIANATIDGEYE